MLPARAYTTDHGVKLKKLAPWPAFVAGQGANSNLRAGAEPAYIGSVTVRTWYMGALPIEGQAWTPGTLLSVVVFPLGQVILSEST